MVWPYLTVIHYSPNEHLARDGDELLASCFSRITAQERVH